jgi:hypothetical protein
MKFELNLQIFKKVPNIKFRQNPSIGSQTDMKLIVAFCNFANAPKHDLLTNFWHTFDNTYVNLYFVLRVSVHLNVPSPRTSWN